MIQFPFSPVSTIAGIGSFSPKSPLLFYEVSEPMNRRALLSGSP